MNIVYHNRIHWLIDEKFELFVNRIKLSKLLD